MEGKLPFILLTALLSATTGELASAAPLTSFILASCQTTHYPALCMQCLAAYGPTVRQSPRQLALAALAVSADRARAAFAFVSRMSAGSSSAVSRDGRAVWDCIQTLRDSADRLRGAVRELRRMRRAGKEEFAWHFGNVKTWASAALTDQSTCLDSLSQDASDAGVRAAIRSKIVEVSRVTSIALVLVNRVGPKN